MGNLPVLLLEDCQTDALLVKHALRRQFDVTHVQTLPQAMKRLETAEHPYAAIITDYRLQGATGLDLLRWISAQGIDVPVMVMSGNGDEQIATEALKLGAYDYIVKSEDTLPSLAVDLRHVLHRHELEQRARMLQQVVENATDAIVTTDMNGVLLTANQAVEVLFGYAPAAAVGRSIEIFFPEKKASEAIAKMLAAGRADRAWQEELSARRKDNSSLLINLSMSVLCDSRGNPTRLIGIARDVTERRRLLDKLKRLSVTDNLTGLFNHRFLHDRLHYEFVRARRYGHPLGCIMIDADYFKSVNDTYGHLVGDEVLKALADLITQATRSIDIVARYGGEEFSVLLPNTDLEGAIRCAHNIWEITNNAEIPTKQGHLKVTVSIGVTSLTPDVLDEEELHRRADAALLAAKRRGRNNVCVWDDTALQTSVEMPDAFEQDLEALCENLRRVVLPARERYMETVRPVLDTLCRRHPMLRRHSTNVSIFAMELARLASMNEEEDEALQYAALFHDIGHITTPTRILNKPGALTPQERKIVRKHVQASATLMMELSLSELEIQYVRYHHERYDGQGYPDGLVGEQIPLGARILAIADSYDAMTSQRPYRRQLSQEEALEELRKNAGTQFDPALVSLFLEAHHVAAVAPLPSQL